MRCIGLYCRRFAAPHLCGILFLLLAGSSSATSPIAVFDQANRLYEQGKFGEAAAGYEQLIASGHRSAIVYYNLGNAWFKAGQLGRAVAAYRHAQQLAPRDPNIRFNLDFARRQVTGSNAPAQSAWQRALGRFTLNEWTILAAVAFWLCFGFLILREANPAWRRLLRSYTIAAGSVAAALVALLGMAVRQHARASEAVVVAQQAIVRYGPLEDSRVHFQLRDGAEVQVLARKQNGAAESWFQVRDGSRRVGWLKSDQVVVL